MDWELYRIQYFCQSFVPSRCRTAVEYCTQTCQLSQFKALINTEMSVRELILCLSRSTVETNVLPDSTRGDVDFYVMLYDFACNCKIIHSSPDNCLNEVT